MTRTQVCLFDVINTKKARLSVSIGYSKGTQNQVFLIVYHSIHCKDREINQCKCSPILNGITYSMPDFMYKIV